MKTLLSIAGFSFAFGTIIGIPIAQQIISMWPGFPIWIISIFLLILYGFIVKLVFKNRFNADESTDNSFLTRHRHPIIFGFLASAIVLGFTFKRINSGTVYFDNGSQSIVKLEYKSKDGKNEIINIPLQAAEIISLPIGKNIVKLNGKETNISIPRNGKYIYNIDTLNTYLLTKVNYISISKGKEIDGDSEKIKELFFPVYADYIFSAPEEILTKRSKVKTVIYRERDYINK